jgi:hypothetical protein
VVAKLNQVQKLIDEGKHYEAAKLLSLDIDAVFRETLGIDKPTVDPTIKALQDEIAALKAGQTLTAEQLKAQEAAAREQGHAKIIAHVSGSPDKFPFLSRNPEWVKETLSGAEEAYETIKSKLGRDLNDAEKQKLLNTALAEGEETHAKRAKLYGATSPAKPTTTPAPSPTITGAVRGNLTPSTTKKPATLEELKALRRQNR